MIKINTSKPEKLTFEFQFGGVSQDQISSTFHISFGGVDYGFPGKITQESIIIEIPPLREVIAKKIKELDEADVSLEVVANGHYSVPWKDKVKIENPFMVEAKIITPTTVDTTVPQPTIIKEEVEVKTAPTPSPDLTENMINQIVSRLQKLITKDSLKEEEMVEKKEVIIDKPMTDDNEEEIEEKCKKEFKEIDNDTAKTINALERLLNKTMNGISESPIKKSKKEITLSEFKKTLTEKQIYQYMASKGAKNKRVQDVVFEQAKKSCKGEQTNANILKEVIKILRDINKEK